MAAVNLTKVPSSVQPEEPPPQPAPEPETTPLVSACKHWVEPVIEEIVRLEVVVLPEVETNCSVAMPDTCKLVKVALVPEAEPKRSNPEIWAEVKVALVNEALPKESSLNCVELLTWKWTKSPLKVGLLKPKIVPDAEPLISENWVAVAERKTKEEVGLSVNLAMVNLAVEVVEPMPT